MSATAKTRRPLQVRKPAGATPARRDFSVEQAGHIFGEIGSLVHTADRLFYHGGADMSPDQALDTIIAVRALLAQMGLLADIGAEKLGAGCIRGVDAEEWLMPPIYPQDSEFMEPQP